MTDGGKHPSHDELMRELAGHRKLLDDYVRRHLPPALWPAYDPADVVQDVFFESLKRSAQFQQIDMGRRPPWLLTVARNRITYLVRRHHSSKRANQAPADVDPDAKLSALLEEIAIYERTPSISAASHEAHAAVRDSMARLSPDHAAVLQSRYFDGLPSKMIAKQAGKSDVAIRQLVVRALAALRGELQQQWIPA